MVFFTCDGCGETLKKSQVDGHANRCRRCDSVSCVDCSISFYGDDYRSHTTCSMTEVDNLVAARGQQQQQQKTNGKHKKQSPQEAWMELLHGSVATAPPAIQSYLEQMVQLDNIPRKEKQFRNFATNSLNLRGGTHAKKILDSIWNYLNQQRETLQQQKEQQLEQQRAKQQKEQEEEKLKSSSKDTTVETTTTETSNTTSNNSNDNNNNSDDDKMVYKNVKKATKKMLKKAPGHSMKYKSLQRALREKVVGVPKKKLKAVMEQVVTKEKQKFLLDGKQIKLVVQ